MNYRITKTETKRDTDLNKFLVTSKMDNLSRLDIDVYLAIDFKDWITPVAELLLGTYEYDDSYDEEDEDADLFSLSEFEFSLLHNHIDNTIHTAINMLYSNRGKVQIDMTNLGITVDIDRSAKYDNIIIEEVECP